MTHVKNKLPKEDIPEFYSTSAYIWTVLGTSGDAKIRCKLDKWKKSTKESANFVRLYKKAGQIFREELVGTFVPSKNPRPTEMHVKSISGEEFNEEVVYQDEKYTCGVIYTSRMEEKNRKRTLCELRVKTQKKQRPTTPKDCNFTACAGMFGPCWERIKTKVLHAR